MGTTSETLLDRRFPKARAKAPLPPRPAPRRASPSPGAGAAPAVTRSTQRRPRRAQVQRLQAGGRSEGPRRPGGSPGRPRDPERGSPRPPGDGEAQGAAAASPAAGRGRPPRRDRETPDDFVPRIVDLQACFRRCLARRVGLQQFPRLHRHLACSSSAIILRHQLGCYGSVQKLAAAVTLSILRSSGFNGIKPKISGRACQSP